LHTNLKKSVTRPALQENGSLEKKSILHNILDLSIRASGSTPELAARRRAAKPLIAVS